MTLRLGVLGLASFYGPAYAERAAAHPACRVEAALPGDRTDDQLAALGRPTREEFARKYDCRLLSSVDEVLSTGVDAAVVATPTRRRADDAVALLEAGVPVLLAKPAAVRATDARQIVETATRSGTRVMMTTPARFDDAVAELGRRVDAGGVGDVVRVSAAIRHDRVPRAGIHANAEHAPGEAGAAYAMSVYTADAILWLSDATPERASAEYANVNTPHSTHPDLGTGTVRFDDGSLASMTMTYSTDCRERLGNWEVEVVGTDGIARTSHQGYEGIHWRAGSPSDRDQEAFGRSTSPILDRQFAAFVAAVDGAEHPGVPAVGSPADPGRVAAALELCEAWKRSADEGEVVAVDGIS